VGECKIALIVRADILLGAATVFMAVLGGIVAAYPPNKDWLRWVYVALFVLAGIASIGLTIEISKENAVANDKLTTALNDLSGKTTEIERISSLNTELQNRLLDQGKTISGLAEEGIKAVTGGDSYCFMTLGGDKTSFSIYNPGDYALTSLTLEMIDYARNHEEHFVRQTLVPHTVWPYRYELPQGDRADFFFTFNALNGSWWETLQLRKVSGVWQQALKVERMPERVRLDGTTKAKRIRQYVDPQYPGEASNAVEWCEFVKSTPTPGPNPCIPNSH
jgi:hypothetical protein